MNDKNIIITQANTITEDIISSRSRIFSNTDVEDFIGDDEIDDIDDDCLESTDEVQHILQTFGNHDCSMSSIDHFDSRRYEIMYEIMNIEKQFEQLKNILYEESVLFIDRKLLSIQNEEAPEYQNELEKLYNEMKIDLEVAKQRRLIELQALENSTQSELLSLEQTLENDKILLYNSIREDVEYRIHELETLKVQTELCENVLKEVLTSEQQLSIKNKRFDSSERHKKSIKKTRYNDTKKMNEKDNLAIFYQLSDIDITEDWALIQASLQQSSSTSDESDNNNDSEKTDNHDDTHMSSND